MKSTGDRLVAAAAWLLDQGGQPAVTMRAVATAVDVSHNAPYKHFAGRTDLLAAVALLDYQALAERWRAIRDAVGEPRQQLLDAFEAIVAFSQAHPARYRLLFGTPDVAVRSDALDDAAETALHAFTNIVIDCQRAGALPSSPSHNLGIMLFATVHGLIDADASGRLRSRTGWADIRAGMGFVLDLIAQPSDPDA